MQNPLHTIEGYGIFNLEGRRRYEGSKYKS